MDETSTPKQPSPPEPSSTLIHERVIQPSAAMVEEMSQQAAATPPAPAPPPAPQPPQPPATPSPGPLPPTYPVATKGLAATPAAPTAASSQAGDYAPNSQKVSARAPSLQLFALVTLILSLLSLGLGLSALALVHRSTLLTHQSSSTTISLSSLIRDVTAVLPMVSAIIFLVSKNVTLVKALLIVMLFNYAVGALDFLFIIFSIHVSLGFEFIISLMIDLGFALWTWSVFTEVNSLALS